MVRIYDYFALKFYQLDVEMGVYVPEVPGSPVPEPKLRDSRLKSRLGIGLGIDIRAM